MSIAPIPADSVELEHLHTDAFGLRVGDNVIHLTATAVADLLALLTLPQYADGNAGQCVHVDREYQPHRDPRTAAVLIAHIGAYDSVHQPTADTVVSERYVAAGPGHKPLPSTLTLAVSANGQTEIAVMSRREALRLIAAATRGMSDAA